MENIIYPTTIFQPSSSSSPQSCSHLSLLNMANSHQAQQHEHEHHHHQEFVVYDDQIKPNNGYMGGMMITNMETTTTTTPTPTPTMEENVNDDKKKGEIKNKSKKPKYAFQTRSQVDILDDGYRWRKYGQKAVKNNKFPRSYYRCTHQGCNVKKQVQRLSKDEGVVVTTYEGMHSHQIQKTTENFDHILTQMQINYTSF